MMTIIHLVIGAAVGGGLTHFYHVKFGKGTIKVNPKPMETGSGNQPPGGGH